MDLREEEEDEEDAENDQAQDEPAGPAIPGAAPVCASVVVVAVGVAAGNVVSRVSKVCLRQAHRERVSCVYILAVLSREENHDVVVAVSVGEACRDGVQVSVVVCPQNWLSAMLRKR